MTLEEINEVIFALCIKAWEARKYQNEFQLTEYATLRHKLYKLCAEREEAYREGTQTAFFNKLASYWEGVAVAGKFEKPF